jgi:hypothetical protein
MRNDMDRGLDRRGNMSGMMIGAIVALAVLGILFMWAPWSGPRTADNTSPGTTVGSTANRPAAPAAPAAPAPAAPAPMAPSK